MANPNSLSAVIVLFVVTATSLGGCRVNTPEAPAPSSSAAVSAQAPRVGSDARLLGVHQRRRADQLVNVFEYSTPTPQYDAAENLRDGRGVTSGRAGFTTATCDAKRVVSDYQTKRPDNPLVAFIPELQRLCAQHISDTSGLPEADYIRAWQQASADPVFRSVQDAVVDSLYYLPAMQVADRIGLGLPLARAELYDAAIQHGFGDDPDGLQALIDRTSARAGLPTPSSQQAWLAAFLDTRLRDLQHPDDAATAAVWAQSTDRVECIKRLLADGNVNLDKPLTVSVYGQIFRIP